MTHQLPSIEQQDNFTAPISENSIRGLCVYIFKKKKNIDSYYSTLQASDERNGK